MFFFFFLGKFSLQSNKRVIFLSRIPPEHKLSQTERIGVSAPTPAPFGNNNKKKKKAVEKPFFIAGKRAPHKPPIKVICIPPVVCCNPETRVFAYDGCG